MALTKTIDNHNIEVVQNWYTHVRTATVLTEDVKELTRSFHRNSLTPGKLDSSDNLVATDISGEDADVQAICNAAWTAQVKTDFTAFLVATKPPA